MFSRHFVISVGKFENYNQMKIRWKYKDVGN